MSRLNAVLNKIATLVMAHKEIIGNATMTTTAQTLTGAVNELDGDITSLNGKTTGVINDAKLPSTITEYSGGSSVQRCGNMVQLTLNLKYTGSGSATISDGFIPAGFRPAYGTRLLGTDGSATGITSGYLNINGGISGIYFGSTKYFQGTFVYIGE